MRVFCLRTTADHPTAQRQRCNCCDILEGCHGNGSSARHPAVSSLTVRRTVTSISYIWVWASQQVFPRVHTQPVQKKYTLERPGARSWTLSLCWGSGLSIHLKRQKDCHVVSHSLGLTEQERICEWSDITLHFPLRWRLSFSVCGWKSRPPLICQLQAKSIHLLHTTVRFTRWELNTECVITFKM